MVTQIKGTDLIERYQRLIDVSRDLASTLDLDALLMRIVQATADLSNAEEASILLYDENQHQLHFQAATNLNEPLLRGIDVPVEGSLAGWIVQNRQPVIITNARDDPRYYENVSKAINVQTTSLLGVPLVANNRMIGALEAINKRKGEFNEDDQNVVMALAAQAAVAIENTRLFQQSDLISELVHELRTPLASLSTASHLLLRPEVSEEQRIRMVEIIQDETFRLSEMTTSFLDLARLQSGRAQYKTEIFGMKELLDDCVAVMQTRIHEKHLALRIEIPGNLPQVKADRNKLKQVALNLLSNAIKYNSPNGSIVLTAGANQQEICFSVKDTGPGISPENMAHLFEKFFRAPGIEQLATGTGLGLSICKAIIEAHHGRIEVSSQVGSGTQFTVFLPTKN